MFQAAYPCHAPCEEQRNAMHFQLWSEIEPIHWLWEENCLGLEQLGSGLKWTLYRIEVPKVGLTHLSFSSLCCSKRLLINGNLLLSLFCYLHAYMVYRWSTVQTCQWSYRSIWDEQGSLSPEATYTRFALWCKKICLFLQTFYWNKQLHKHE